MNTALTEREKGALGIIKEQLTVIGASDYLKGYVAGQAEAMAEARQRFETERTQKESA